jgi:hypothetical protein
MDTSRIKDSLGLPASDPNNTRFKTYDERGGSGEAVKYAIAAVIVGSVIANMFIGKRFRSYKHVRSPMGKGPQEPLPFEMPSPRNHYRNDHINERNYRSYNAYKGPYPPSGDINSGAVHSKSMQAELAFHKKYKVWSANGCPDEPLADRPHFTFGAASGASSSGAEWQSYLSVLNLNTNVVPLKAEVKAAYRRSALKHHPDQGGTGDSTAFAAAADAQKQLLRKIVELEKRLAGVDGV